MSLGSEDGRIASQHVQHFIRGLPEDLKSMFVQHQVTNPQVYQDLTLGQHLDQFLKLGQSWLTAHAAAHTSGNVKSAPASADKFAFHADHNRARVLGVLLPLHVQHLRPAGQQIGQSQLAGSSSESSTSLMTRLLTIVVVLLTVTPRTIGPTAHGSRRSSSTAGGVIFAGSRANPLWTAQKCALRARCTS